MPGEVLIALAQWAGQTVAAAAVADAWESARHKFARLLGRGDPRKTEVAERWLEQTHQQLTAVEGTDLESATAAQAQRWEARFADLLDRLPDVEADLRALIEEIQAQAPDRGRNHGRSFAGGRERLEHRRQREYRRSGRGGGSGCARLDFGKPSYPGPGQGLLAGPGATTNIGPRSTVALGGVAIDRLEYQRPEVASQPVQLPSRLAPLAGREELPAELDARLSGDDSPEP